MLKLGSVISFRRITCLTTAPNQSLAVKGLRVLVQPSENSSSPQLPVDFSTRQGTRDQRSHQPFVRGPQELLPVRCKFKSTRPPKGTARLTVKTTTKAHRFSHYIKSDREIELRKFWQETREVQNQAFIHRYINFSRIYARFRDLKYLQHTMLHWDAAIDRLFSHSKGKQPANDLVRKHPYVLNAKILPLQFAKNAVKGHLPLYNWRLVLRDLKKFAGETEGKIEDEDSESMQDRTYQDNKSIPASLPKEEHNSWLDLEPSPGTRQTGA